MVTLVVWPGFVGLAAWLGWTASQSPYLAAQRTLGLIIGSLLAGVVGGRLIAAFAVGRDDLANTAILLLLVGWVAASLAGALLVPRILSRKQKSAR
jgi:hypothetical protein